MKVHRPFAAKLAVRKPVIGAIAGAVVVSLVSGGLAYADPAEDNVAKVEEMSRQAEQLSETILNAQPDLDKKMQLLADADRNHTDDMARLELARTQLATYQRTVDKFAAGVYMGGRTDGGTALLVASSPSNLIADLTVRRVVGNEMSEQLQAFRQASQAAQASEAASAESAAQAKAAVDAAVAVRSDLQNKRAELRAKMAEVNASYATLAPAQQAALTLPTAAVTEALGPVAPIPTVGMGGIVPNARVLLDYIMATYPGVQSIGGVRPDSLPDHPSGHALDIMIGSDMGLGDAINADLRNQAARFGVKYTMWREAAHYDHVHVTVF